METEASSPCSQAPAICPYRELNHSSPCPHPTSQRCILILSFLLCLGLPSDLFRPGLPTKTLSAPLFSPIPYNLTQLISRFACLSPTESKCSKCQDGNFRNNLTLLILFILFHDCWNTQMCWIYGCAFKNNVITASFCLTFTTCHLQGIKQTLPYVKISNLLSSNLSSLLFSLFPIGCLFKSPYSLIESPVKNLNTLFLLVHLRNTIPLSYWSFYLSVALSLSLTVYPCKLLHKTAQSIKYKILTTNKIETLTVINIISEKVKTPHKKELGNFKSWKLITILGLCNIEAWARGWKAGETRIIYYCGGEITMKMVTD